MNKHLVENIQSQTKRLISQLNELEELKTELDPSEYESLKKDTLDQLEKFSTSLQEKLKSGDLSLLDQIKKSQLEIQAVVKQSFDIGKIKEKLVGGEVSSLRDQIAILQRDFSLGRIPESKYLKEKLTLINNLQELKAELTVEERVFLEENTGKANFVNAKKGPDLGKQKTLLKEAEKQLKH